MDVVADAAHAKERAVTAAMARNAHASERRLIAMQSQVNTLRREVGCTSSSRSGIRAVKKPEVKVGVAARYMSAIKGGRG